MQINQKIDCLCGEFEESWKSGGIPAIHEFVERISTAARLELLGRIVLVDLVYRLGRGEIPNAADYASAGPDAMEVAERELKHLEASGRLPPEMAYPVDSKFDAPTLIPVVANDSGVDETLIGPVEPEAQQNEQTIVRESVRYFGDYELLSEIARGGMGVIYKARQVNLNRIVALKMILAGQLASEVEVQRFRKEAEAAANLDHPGIVPIFEVGQHEGQHFFSMGYVDGCSLADRVRNGPLPPREAAELTKKTAEAIAFAHSRNVIHRDLKPANVLLDQYNEPRVTDFGLAKKTDCDSGMTQTGAVMGTPSYMPPEQASGKNSEVGPLADVYSLGATLYCLLTGRPPFQAANPFDTLLLVIDCEPVPIRIINPLIDRDLETICLKCLRKNQDLRYSDAIALITDLDRYLNDQPILARPPSVAERASGWARMHVTGLTVFSVLFVSFVIWLPVLQVLNQDSAERASDLKFEIPPNAALMSRPDLVADKLSETIRELSPTATLHYSRALAHFQMRRFEDCIADTSAALELGEEEWRPRYLRGLAHQRQGDHEAAVADFDAALLIVKDVAEVYFSKSISCLQIKDENECLRCIGRAIELMPGYAEAFVVRSEAYSQKGDRDAALLDRLQAHRLGARSQ